ncbi:MAG: alpha/beta fold hydrolase [Acidimicrobiales bacterium]
MAIERIPYDEMAMFQENAEEFGLPYASPPVVHCTSVDLEAGRQLSALVWGDGEAELVFLHGGAQNAHTWDTVAMALDRPLVAIDLPGHGHSDGGRNGYLDVAANADDVAVAIRALAPRAKVVVGMSLGGATALALAGAHPDVVRSIVLVDVTPGVDGDKAKQIIAFINGPESFPSFEEILARTIEFNPTRTEASLRRGILHNAVQLDDGSWVWRYARHRGAQPTTTSSPDLLDLWEVVSGLDVPLMLVRGMRPQSVVVDSDEAELLRRKPEARVEHVTEAGHSVQGDAPLELAALIEDFVRRQR